MGDVRYRANINRRMIRKWNLARRLRIAFPGAFYHVSTPGNERKAVFKSIRDRQKFLEYLETATERYNAVIHAYCLMDNHYHLLLETPSGNLPQPALGRSLKKEDYLYYNHRGHGLPKVLPKGMSPKAFIAEHYGRATGAAGGFAGFHNCDIDIGIPGMGGMVGGEATLAAGTA